VLQQYYYKELYNFSEGTREAARSERAVKVAGKGGR